MDSEKNVWTIYMYTFPNGKRYIGATTRPMIYRQGTPEKGWERYKNSKLLYAAIQEFGVDSIEQTILYQGEIENTLAAELEGFFIELYRTNVNHYDNPSFGYNQTDGGEGTTKKRISEETVRKLREQMRRFHEAKRGTHASEETRRRLSVSHMGQKRGLMPLEQRRKISNTNSKREKRPSPNSRKGEVFKQAVIMHDISTGETLRFQSFTDAGYYNGVNGATVSRWVSGKRRPPENLIFVKEREMDPDCGWEVKEAKIS